MRFGRSCYSISRGSNLQQAHGSGALMLRGPIHSDRKPQAPVILCALRDLAVSLVLKTQFLPVWEGIALVGVNGFGLGDPNRDQPGELLFARKPWKVTFHLSFHLFRLSANSRLLRALQLQQRVSQEPRSILIAVFSSFASRVVAGGASSLVD